jgi:hypothetical protein
MIGHSYKIRLGNCCVLWSAVQEWIRADNMRHPRGWRLLALSLATVARSQRFDAFFGRVQRSPAPRGTQQAHLIPPHFDWADADAAKPPATIASTSHYRTGESARPGAFAVAPDSMRRLVPAAHDAQTTHRADWPEVEPAAPHVRTSHSASYQTNDGATSLEWADGVQLESRAASSMEPRGLPPQPTVDWADGPRWLTHTQHTEHHNGRAPQQTDTEIGAPSIHAAESEVAEWGSLARVSGGGATLTNDTTDSAAVHGVRDSAPPVPSSRGQPPLEPCASTEASTPSSEPCARQASGEVWWVGERRVTSWKLLSLAAKAESRRPLGTQGTSGGHVGASEDEWEDAAPIGSNQPRAPDTVQIAAAPVVAMGARDSAAIRPLGGLNDGEVGAVYEAQYGAQVPPR